MSCKDRNINFNSGLNGCNDKISILKNEVVQRDLSKFNEMTREDVDIDSYLYVDHIVDDKAVPSKIKISEITAGAIQADWDQEDATKMDYIKNKPEIILDEDLISLYNIGGIKLGQVFEKGTPYIDIMKELLSTSHPEVFRFGTVEDLFNFDIESVREFTVQTTELIADGWVSPEITFNNNYLALLIPEDSHVDVRRVYQAGYALDLDEIDEYTVLDSERKVWRLYTNAERAPITGTFVFVFKFKFTGQE